LRLKKPVQNPREVAEIVAIQALSFIAGEPERLGLFLAESMVQALLSFLPSGDSPLILTARPDPRILAFNAVVALVAGLLFGLAPALSRMRTTSANPAARPGSAGPQRVKSRCSVNAIAGTPTSRARSHAPVIDAWSVVS